MSKLRLFPFLTTIAISAALLFGGWYTYNQTIVERPLQQMVDSLPGVASAVPSLTKDAVIVELKLKSGADLRSIYEGIQQRGSKVIGSRELQLKIDEPSNAKLDSLWATQLFTVAEAMANSRYAAIPDALKSMEKNNPGLKTTTSIDDKNVYVTLQLGNDSKSIILPRETHKMGVWPNA